MVESLRFSISGLLKFVPLSLPVFSLIVYPGSVWAGSVTQPNHATKKGLSFIEAVRDTIQKQTDILLQQQKMEESKGAF